MNEVQSSIVTGTYYVERHPVDEALGCMVPFVSGVLGAFAILVAFIAVVLGHII